MLKTRKDCSVCQAVKLNKILLEKIYASAAYVPGGPSLKELHKDYANKFSYPSLLNHTKKHQFLSQDDFTKRHLSHIAKQAEKQILKKQVEAQDIWSNVMDAGMEKLEKGELHIKAGDLLKAAKDKSDYDFKKKDQELAFMEMVMFFASGENNKSLNKPYESSVLNERTLIDAEQSTNSLPAETQPNIHVAEGTTGDTGQGEDGSSSVYYPPAWDATT